MTPRSLSPVPENDKERALDTLVLAFAADPVERWLYPGSREYLTCFPAFLAAFGGRAFAEETVWSLPDFSAVALWLPPGAEADGDAIVAVLIGTVASERHEDTLAVLGQMDDAHPRFPHWYLPWLGVDPSLQGRGPRWGADRALPSDRGRGASAGLSRNPKSTHQPVLRAIWLRSHRRSAGGSMSAHRPHAEARAVIEALVGEPAP